MLLEDSGLPSLQSKSILLYNVTYNSYLWWIVVLAGFVLLLFARGCCFFWPSPSALSGWPFLGRRGFLLGDGLLIVVVLTIIDNLLNFVIVGVCSTGVVTTPIYFNLSQLTFFVLCRVRVNAGYFFSITGPKKVAYSWPKMFLLFFCWWPICCCQQETQAKALITSERS